MGKDRARRPAPLPRAVTGLSGDERTTEVRPEKKQRRGWGALRRVRLVLVRLGGSEGCLTKLHGSC